MKLEEGMYVRTKDGLIRKCVTVDLEDTDAYELDDYIYVEYGDEINWLDEAELEKYISKSGYNIIDLIEEGDYVNGYPVVDFDVTYFNGIDRREEPKWIGVIVEKNMGFSKTYFKNEDIKTILTKEQYENNCYRIEE